MHINLLEQLDQIDDPEFVDTVGPACVAACTFAVLAGFSWGFVANYFGFKSCLPALLVGCFAALGIRLISHKDDVRIFHQISAVVACCVGVIVGKYIIFFKSLSLFYDQKFNGKAMVELSAVSAGAFISFMDSARKLISGIDIVWVVLAVVIAWWLPRQKVPNLSRFRFPTFKQTIPQKS